MRPAVFALLLVLPTAAAAQQKPAPVQEVTADREATLQRAQMRAGAAYRDLRETQHQSKLAQQEVWAAEEAAKAPGADAAESKRRLGAAVKARDAAAAKETAARAAYDKTLTEVERLQRPETAK